MQDRHRTDIPSVSLASPSGVLDAAKAAPRVMMYSHDGFGMGHVRRNANIASRFVRDIPGADVLMVAGCSTGTLFELPRGVDFLQLPSIVKVATNTWQPRNFNMGATQLHDLRARLIMQAARSFAPQAFVVDHVPTGVWHELVPTLEMFRGLANPPRIILGLRDILDAPEVVQETWRRESTYDLITKYYDGIFVYGCPEVYDTAGRYGLNDCLPGKVQYCGYVCAENGSRSHGSVRLPLDTGKSKLIVVTAGGGNDAYPMMSATLDALRQLGGDGRLRAIVVTGPLMDSGERRQLQRQADGLPARVLAYTPDLHEYLRAADLIVTMAGYNTLMESIALCKRILVMPRRGPSAEQRMRASILAEMGIVETVDPQKIGVAALAEKIRDCLASDAAVSSTLTMNGAESATAKLADLIEERRSINGCALPETAEKLLVAG